MDLTGKVAVVTGASSGVGSATALALATRGARVMVNYRQSREGAEAVVNRIVAEGGQATMFQADVADDEQSRALVAATIQDLGPIQVLVNNAGTTQFIPFDDLEGATDEAWQHIMGVNVLGGFHMIRAVAPSMQSAGGEIVNVSSVAGIAATGSSIPYACSKSAVNTLTVALARTLARHQIRVNAVAPGFIAGRWLEEGLGERYARVKQRYEDRVPLRRVCEPADIARAILSLIEGSDLVTGQIVACDGGMNLMDPMGLE